MPQARKEQKGYLAAVFGGVSGAIALLTLGILLAKVYIAQFLPHPKPEQLFPVTFSVMTGVGCGEIFGGWLALRWRKHRAAGRTAVWLAALTLPGWLFFFAISTLFGVVMGATLIIIALPLLARAMVNNSQPSNNLYRTMSVFARRPPNF